MPYFLGDGPAKSVAAVFQHCYVKCTNILQFSCERPLFLGHVHFSSSTLRWSTAQANR